VIEKLILILVCYIALVATLFLLAALAKDPVKNWRIHP